MSNTFLPGHTYRATSDIGVLKRAVATASAIKGELTKMGFKDVTVWTDAGDLPADWGDAARRDGSRFIQGTYAGTTPLTVTPKDSWSVVDVWLYRTPQPAPPAPTPPVPPGPVYMRPPPGGNVFVPQAPVALRDLQLTPTPAWEGMVVSPVPRATTPTWLLVGVGLGLAGAAGLAWRRFSKRAKKREKKR